MDTLWVDGYLEGKYNLTYERCLNGEMTFAAERNFTHLLTLTGELNRHLFSVGKPDSRSVKELVHQVAHFLRTAGENLKSVGAFCGDSEQCLACVKAKASPTDEANWQALAQLYKWKLDSIGRRALYCKWALTRTCRSQLANRPGGTLWDTFQALSRLLNSALNKPEAKMSPTGRQRKVWTEMTHQLVSKANQELDSATPFDVCGLDHICEKCLKYNVDCWNSNAAYRRSSEYYCKTPEEWTLLRYKPSIIDGLHCQERQL